MGPLALFDLDDTLIAMPPAFRRFAADFVQERGLPAGAEEWLVAEWHPYQRRDMFFGVVRERYGLAEPVEELWRLYRQRMPEYVVLRGDVHDGLVALRQAGWRLGIVTNGEADNQLGKIERTGLDRMVDAVAVSGALGIRKPDAEIFRVAAEGAGCGLDGGGWMVGDNPTLDVGGGAAVGLRTAWVDKAGERDLLAVSADVVVGDVVEAIAVLLERG